MKRIIASNVLTAAIIMALLPVFEWLFGMPIDVAYNSFWAALSFIVFMMWDWYWLNRGTQGE